MNFIKLRKKSYLVSGILVIFSLFAIFVFPMNLGIDMTGGIQIEYGVSKVPEKNELNSLADSIKKDYTYQNESVLNDVIIYRLNNSDDIRVETGFSSTIPEDTLDAAKQDFRTQVPGFFENTGVQVVENSYVNIGNSFGQYVKRTARFTVIFSLIVIALYVTIAFRKSVKRLSSFAFGGITLVTLFHDILIASGLYMGLSLVFPELKIDTYFVTALLTILGYSINDTIVILDRVRFTHTSPKSANWPLDKILNNSIGTSLRRSLYTSLTLILVLLSMILFGPESLRGFTLLLLLGTIVGTYSSVMIAAPMVYDLERKSAN